MKRFIVSLLLVGCIFMVVKLYQHNRYVRQSYFIQTQWFAFQKLLQTKEQAIVDLHKASDYNLLHARAQDQGYVPVKRFNIISNFAGGIL